MIYRTTRRHALVTGGLGFIGSTITERLLQRGLEVTVVHNELSNVIKSADLVEKFPKARYVKAGISEYLLGKGSHLQCDLVIHAASYVGSAGVLKYAGTIAKDMIEAMSRVIGFCLRNDADLFNISSSEVYGKSGVLSESTDLRVPPYFNARIEYALAKLTGEAMIHNSDKKGLRAISIRPFNVAGPRQSRVGGFVFPTFVQQALGNKPLTVFETGLQKRSFINVEDVADFLELCLHRPFGAPMSVNLGNPDNTTAIIDLAHEVRTQLRSDSKILHVDPRSVYGSDYREAESIQKVCDISVARKLGWSPNTSLKDIIKETSDYYGVYPDTGGADARGYGNCVGVGRVAAWR